MKVPPSTAPVTGGSTAQPAGTAGTARAKGASGGTSPASPGADAVRLSPLSTQLQALASSLSGPEFDRAKVDQVKQAIRDGKLQVRTDVVADRIIADVKERLAKAGK